MKQSYITLRKFVETFPLESKQIIIEKGLPDNVLELPYEDKYRFVKNHIGDSYYRLIVQSDCIYFRIYHTTLRRIGNRFFKGTLSNDYIRISTNTIQIKTNYLMVIEFLKVCNLDWFRDIPSCIVSYAFVKPSIIRGVLTKRIYNEETFYRALAAKCFKITNVGWRNLKYYFTEVGYRANLFDLKAFTKNIDESIIALRERSNTPLIDLLECAVKLNQIVDFTWSDRRIHQEHQKQIWELNRREITEKDNKPIYETTLSGEHIRMLNTEKDIYLEGLNMHHCLYSCYFHRIQRKEYIAFHMTYPEDCTFSVRKGSNTTIAFDQIFLKYDQRVQPETKNIALDFINCNLDVLKKMFNEEVIIDNKLLFHEDLPYAIPDIPF